MTVQTTPFVMAKTNGEYAEAGPQPRDIFGGGNYFNLLLHYFSGGKRL